MAQYPFENEDGEQIFREYPMEDAPEFGAEITLLGVVYRRVMSRMSKPQIARMIRSIQIEDNHPDVPYYDQDNMACFPGGLPQAKEFARKHNGLVEADELGIDT